MQPQLRKVPPARSSSMHATFLPSCPALMAPAYPAGPPPMTMRSYSVASAMASTCPPFGGRQLNIDHVSALGRGAPRGAWRRAPGRACGRVHDKIGQAHNERPSHGRPEARHGEAADELPAKHEQEGIDNHNSQAHRDDDE